MIEKRLTERMTKYWELLRKDDVMPPFAKFNSAAIDDMWGNCILFKVNKSTDAEKSYTFFRVGDGIKSLYKEDLIGNTLKAKQRMFKGATVIKRIDEIIADPKPIYDAGQFANTNNKVVKFRSCLLPFGSENEVTHVVAGLSWREFG